MRGKECHRPDQDCQNELESSVFVDILWQKFCRIPVLSKIKFGEYLIWISIHQVMTADKQTSDVLYKSGETGNPKFLTLW